MNETRMSLATDWTGEDPAGWLMSEKLDGARSYWDGSQLWTRGGNVINAPQWFTRGLPHGVHLDGEIWAGRGNFERAKVAVQHGRFTRAIRFGVFDSPTATGTWSERMTAARAALRDAPHAFAVDFRVCHSLDDLAGEFFRIVDANGEGVMLRSPSARGYVQGRTKTMLRCKVGGAFTHLLFETHIGQCVIT